MLSIIIPVFNSEAILGGLLNSIQCSEFNDYEVIVVDDLSSDATAFIIKDYGVKGVFLSVHSGPAVARNKGAEIAQGEILVFFDSDIEIETDTLSKIVKRFRENPEIKVLVGTYADRPLNKGYFPRFKALWFKSLFEDTDTQTDSLEGFCVAIDKKVFNSAGGFNPYFQRSGVEDYELGCRLRQKYPLYFDRGIQVKHHFPYFLENGIQFFRRSYDFATLFLRQDKSSRGSSLNRDGFASLSSFVSFLLLPFVAMHSLYGTFLFLIFIIVFCFCGRKFIRLAFSKEGLLFTITSIFTYYINGIIVGSGIMLGTLRYFLAFRSAFRRFFFMKIVRYAKFLSCLLNSSIPYLILFVTSRCNNRCKYCFNWRNSENAIAKNELSIEEIAKISANMKNVVYVTITGGEPLLRDDIVEICKIFYRNNTRLISLHTNGYLPQKLNRVISEIIQSCPHLYLDVCLSLDGLQEYNDEVRGVQNSFKNILESVKLIKEIRKDKKNIGIEINTTYSYYTKDYMKLIYNFVTEELKLSYNFCLVRGCTKEELAKDISLDEFGDFIINYSNYSQKTNSSGYPLASFVTIIRKLVPEISIKNLRQKKQFLPCLAGKKVFVISEKGEVYPCELLSHSFGNLRNHDYNINALLKSKRTGEILQDIENGNCYCSWECPVPVNLIYTSKGRNLIMKRWIKDRLRKLIL